MKTLNKEKFSHKIKLFVADKPALARTFDIFEPEPEEDIAVYAAFTGSVHEIPSLARRARKVKN